MFTPLKQLNLMEYFSSTDCAKVADCWLAKFAPAPKEISRDYTEEDVNYYEDFVIFPEEVSHPVLFSHTCTC